MLTPDIIKLKDFYASPIGVQAQSIISDSIRRFWPQAKNECVLGMGYATPYLHPYLDQSELLVAGMPGRQGAAYWPANRTNLVFLSHQYALPLRENVFNRVLLVHSLETSGQLSDMLAEVWRVLTPGGRALVVVPNRLSIWSRVARTPFGYGLPFTMPQLKTLMKDHSFTVTHSASALFIPPFKSRIMWRSASAFELLGKMLGMNVGGVLMLEVEKQLYAGIKQPVAARRYARAPAARPAMTSVSSRISLSSHKAG